ncbi:NAD-dependent epimerase/dehydratase family protein [Candidatus Bathyarchaeota archaeon]|nr:NAD-dependent epimerase/dehydratase family protein [Candidatus Bathyarchaeota archaeon]
MSKKRIVITGANGFVGSATLEHYANCEDEVLAIDITPKNAYPNHIKDATNVTVLTCDINNPDLHSFLQSDDCVLHLAAIATFTEAEQNPTKALAVNVRGTLNVVDACMKASVNRLVFSSTGSVLSQKATAPFKEDAPVDPPNYYGWTKLVGEELIRRFCKVPWVILRYGYIYGSAKLHGAIGSFFKNLREDKPSTIFGGKQTNDFTYIADIVQANHLALHTSYTNEVFHIGSGRANSILDVYDACAIALGKDIKPIIAPAREGDYGIFLYDIAKAERLLGYYPKYSILGGIKELAILLANKESTKCSRESLCQL